MSHPLPHLQAYKITLEGIKYCQSRKAQWTFKAIQRTLQSIDWPSALLLFPSSMIYSTSQTCPTKEATIAGRHQLERHLRLIDRYIAYRINIIPSPTKA